MYKYIENVIRVYTMGGKEQFWWDFDSESVGY